MLLHHPGAHTLKHLKSATCKCVIHSEKNTLNVDLTVGQWKILSIRHTQQLVLMLHKRTTYIHI